MLTEFLLGATLAAILIAASLFYAALDDIRQHLERIEQRQRMIADELDMDESPDIDRAIAIDMYKW